MNPHKSTAKRPPLVAWTLRLVLCITDPRTEAGEVERLIERSARTLSVAEHVAVVAAAKACMDTIRVHAAALAELQEAQAQVAS